MPSIASQLHSARGPTVVLVTPAPPRLGHARRALGVAIAAYVALLSVLAALTAAPAARRFGSPGLPEVLWWGDGIATGLASAAVRALPIGFALAFGRRRRDPFAHRLAIALAGVAVVLVTEVTRWLTRVPVRPLIVLAGAAAAVGGAVLYERAFAARHADPTVGSFTERVLPLELPLTGAALLLVPHLWLASQDALRLPILSLLGCFGASLLTSARVSRGPAAGGAWTHALVAGAWVATATLPAWPVAPRDAALLTVGVALFAAAHALLRPPDATDRRFEMPALRRALPLLAVYLLVAAAWPMGAPWVSPDEMALAWGWGRHGARGALQQATLFAVVGYVLAEARGRREERSGAAWRSLAPWVVLGAAALEVARGLHARGDASAARFAAAVLAAWFGVAIYTRHRDHVRAWRAAGGRVGGKVTRVGLRDPDARTAGGRRRG